VLLERGRDGALPRRIAAAVLALALQHATDWSDLIQPWILRHGECVDPRALLSELRGAPVRDRERAMGYLQAARGALPHACRSATVLFREGEEEAATRIALIALERDGDRPSRGRQERRLRLRALTGMARAANELGTLHDVRLAARLLVEVGRAKPDADLAEFLQAALFFPSDDAEAGSYNQQLEQFQDEAEDFAIALLRSGAEAELGAVIRIIKRNLLWNLPRDRRVLIDITGSDIVVRGLEAADSPALEETPGFGRNS